MTIPTLAQEAIQLVLDALQDGIYVTDGTGTTLWLNEAYTARTGIKKEDVIGKHVTELVRKGFFNESISLKVIDRREPIVILQRIKDMDEVWLVRGTPVFDETGVVTMVINTIHDVTALTKLKAELKAKDKHVLQMAEELQHLRSQILDIEGFIASSYAMKKVLYDVQRVAEVDTTVLLLGESGTGKSQISKLIHRLSPYKEGPFVQVNCGAIPEHLLESELFGYAKGAFTGANKDGKIGLFELANGGTLFLDEIGEMPLSLQVKLLHVLQERKIRRIGEGKERDVQFRLVAATNRNLEEMVESKQFRQDLYYRLAVVPIIIPALRERKDDILPLLEHLLHKCCRKYNKEKTMSDQVKFVLESYSWPGNVRELENLVEQLVIMSPERCIHAHDLPGKYYAGPSGGTRQLDPDSLRNYVDSIEKDLILEVWERTKNQEEAAKVLGIHRTTFSRKVKKLGIRLT